nr:immunoglobulin heavy chain junction region [Mus musculus]
CARSPYDAMDYW